LWIFYEEDFIKESFGSFIGVSRTRARGKECYDDLASNYEIYFISPFQEDINRYIGS